VQLVSVLRWRTTYSKESLTISAKPVGVGTAFQPLILAGERIFVGDAMAVEAGGTGKNEK
jgi:Flp pilus assembly secretin CpaC